MPVAHSASIRWRNRTGPGENVARSGSCAVSHPASMPSEAGPKSTGIGCQLSHGTEMHPARNGVRLAAMCSICRCIAGCANGSLRCAEPAQSSSQGAPHAHQCHRCRRRTRTPGEAVAELSAPDLDHLERRLGAWPNGLDVPLETATSFDRGRRRAAGGTDPVGLGADEVVELPVGNPDGPHGMGDVPCDRSAPDDRLAVGVPVRGRLPPAAVHRRTESDVVGAVRQHASARRRVDRIHGDRGLRRQERGGQTVRDLQSVPALDVRRRDLRRAAGIGAQPHGRGRRGTRDRLAMRHAPRHGHAGS